MIQSLAALVSPNPSLTKAHSWHTQPELDTFPAHVINFSPSLTLVCNDIHTIRFTANPLMSRRINVMIDDDTWGFLARVPAGDRSRTINEALRTWVARRRRADAVREMDQLSARLPSVGTEEVAHWIREDRDQDH